MTDVRPIAVVGGGLAGLAAAVALASHGVPVELIEARRRLGGRAASFADASSAELVDLCQHVSMGCCTNLDDFCRRTGTAHLLRREPVLQFFTRDGRSSRLAAVPLLPAPLHLGPPLLKLHYLTWRERIGISRTMLQLARATPHQLAGQTVAQWLAAHGQTPQAIDRFWAVVLVSALGESVEHASMLHAQKVFVDAFLAARSAYEVYIPEVSLAELYGERLTSWLIEAGVRLRLGTTIEQIDRTTEGLTLTTSEGTQQPGAVVLAVPWHRVRQLPSASLLAALPELVRVDEISAAPITGVHLWFDRAITELPHAVFVDMLSQWLFRRTDLEQSRRTEEFYYQVVISASRQIAGRDRSAVVADICQELGDVWPAARAAKLLRWKMVSDPAAVFSVRPGIEEIRPRQKTSVKDLYLAGDWTKTGWPSTMEGAVRSGYLAAEAVLQDLGRPAQLVQPDLPRGLLARLLVGNAPT